MDASEPRYSCTTCGRIRECRRHRRAAFPPAAARKWLVKTCTLSDKISCRLVYRAGVALGMMRLEGHEQERVAPEGEGLVE